jgi:hypothetical protein
MGGHIGKRREGEEEGERGRPRNRKGEGPVRKEAQVLALSHCLTGSLPSTPSTWSPPWAAGPMTTALSTITWSPAWKLLGDPEDLIGLCTPNPPPNL